MTEFKSAPYDYERAFAESVRAKSEAVLVLVSARFVLARQQIPALALKHRLPSIFGNYLWAEAGALMSYGPNFSEFYRRAAEQGEPHPQGREARRHPRGGGRSAGAGHQPEDDEGAGDRDPPAGALRADRVIER